MLVSRAGSTTRNLEILHVLVHHNEAQEQHQCDQPWEEAADAPDENSSQREDHNDSEPVEGPPVDTFVQLAKTAHK
ncbi:hypothetical protein JVU11DRAFT_10669 [Chiua virens]|nr:hypothetical protein JVU11DRAFT_10669 [Chiua virens]